MEHGSEDFVSYITSSKCYSFDSRGNVINPKLGQQGPGLVFLVPMVIKRWKSIVKEKLRGGFRFLKALSQNFEVLTPRGDIINPKMDQKGPDWYFMYQYWLKDKNKK